MNEPLQKRKATDGRTQKVAHLTEECLDEQNMSYLMLHCASPKANRGPQGAIWGWVLPLRLHSHQSSCAESALTDADGGHKGRGSLGSVPTC